MYEWEKQYNNIFGNDSNNNDIEFKSFAALLRYMRVTRGYTQAELAHRIGVCRSCIANYETAERMPSRTNMRLLVQILRIDMAKYYILLI